jgi:hypothetical protein
MALIKHFYGLSDDLVLASLLAIPYMQFFCGEEYFQYQLPCDPISPVKWRKQVGMAGIEQSLKRCQRQPNGSNLSPTKRQRRIAQLTYKRVSCPATRRLTRTAAPASR